MDLEGQGSMWAIPPSKKKDHQHRLFLLILFEKRGKSKDKSIYRLPDLRYGIEKLTRNHISYYSNSSPIKLENFILVVRREALNFSRFMTEYDQNLYILKK